MKVLLVGPYPPPHGGVSVHLATARENLRDSGIECRVINVDRTAAASTEYTRIRGGLHLACLILGYSVRRWTVHVHISGHNRKGWLVALLCACAGRPAQGRVLTLHSGMSPQYLDSCDRSTRALVAFTCRNYDRIICVNSQLVATIARVGGMPRERLQMLPAFLGSRTPLCAIPDHAARWLEAHEPVLSTVLWFRPEYAFDLLIDTFEALRSRYPHAGLLVMGDSEHTPAARQMTISRGLGESVLLLGDTSHDLCLALMSRSDLFVRATLADGDAISVREALAAGVPVVASDVGARPPAAMLFTAGERSDFLAKLETALSRNNSPVPERSAFGVTGPFGRLLDIYGQING